MFPFYSEIPCNSKGLSVTVFEPQRLGPSWGSANLYQYKNNFLECDEREKRGSYSIEPQKLSDKLCQRGKREEKWQRWKKRLKQHKTTQTFRQTVSKCLKSVKKSQSKGSARVSSGFLHQSTVSNLFQGFFYVPPQYRWAWRCRVCVCGLSSCGDRPILWNMKCSQQESSRIWAIDNSCAEFEPLST